MADAFRKNRSGKRLMNAGWLIFGLCVFFILGAAIPLIRDRGSDRTPLPPKKETLHDWRNEK
jgi:hypothetical protein